jgi:hypothetical protein
MTDKKPSRKAELEAKVARQFSMANLPAWEPHFYFCPGRRWNFDFAWPDCKVACEINGGTFLPAKHGHTNGAHLHGEYEKLNAGQTMGWIVLQFDTKHVSANEVVTGVFDALAARGAITTKLNAGEFSLRR